MQYVIAVGYSNGANIASSMLLLRPQVLSNAILFRAMVPLVPEVLPDLANKHIFMSSGQHDPIVAKQDTESLFSLFKKAGATVSLYWQNSGHELRMEEFMEAKEWLSSSYSACLFRPGKTHFQAREIAPGICLSIRRSVQRIIF